MLSIQALKLLKYIVRKIERGGIDPAKPETFLTYKMVHDDLGLQMAGPTYGLSLLHNGLEELVIFLKSNQKPAISGLIVNAKNDPKRPSQPGEDFFRYYDRGVDDYDWWLSQAKLAVEYDWKQILSTYGTEPNEGVLTYPDEIRNTEYLIEGAMKSTVVNSYERNAKGRLKCLEYYGYNCYICGFNFEQHFGEIGRNYIHVHHLIPVAKLKRSYVLDPINDLRPVCPNCHAMFHQKKDDPYTFTIEELKAILRH